MAQGVIPRASVYFGGSMMGTRSYEAYGNRLPSIFKAFNELRMAIQVGSKIFTSSKLRMYYQVLSLLSSDPL